MNIPAEPASSVHDRVERNGAQAYTFLQAFRRLGPGPHRFQEIIRHSGLSKSEAHRRLCQLVDADLCRRPGHGFYELLPHLPPEEPASLPHPGAVLPHSRLLTSLLDELHLRTRQPVLLHTYAPLSGERVCAAAVGTHGPRIFNDLAAAPQAAGALRQAPLDADAAGLAMLAHLCADDARLREDLRRIRRAGMACTDSPLPGWSMVAVPLHRLPGTSAVPGAEPSVVGALSILPPEPAAGTRLLAYGRLLQDAVKRAESGAAAAYPDLAPVRAA